MTIGRKYERDIDLLLAEEFMVSEPFANWFLAKTKFVGLEARVKDVFVSKSEVSTGESDLVVLYWNQENTMLFAIHIEDKIDAPLQPEQEARYRLRAKREVEQGKYADYQVFLCAPEFYKANQPKTAYFDGFVSYEEMAKFIAANDRSPRGKYRSDFIATATSRNLNNWQRVEDEQTNTFWSEVYKIASRDFTILEMKDPHFTKGQSWITFRPHNMPTMPRRIYLSLKGEKGYIDLTFSNCIAHIFENAVRSILESGMTVHQTGKSTAIRLSFAPFNVCDPFESTANRVREALASCEKLVRFFTLNREQLIGAAMALH